MTKAEEYIKTMDAHIEWCKSEGFEDAQYNEEAGKEVAIEMNHKTLEDVEELIKETIPKITDECYQGIENGFKHYGIDCKLGREILLDELKTLKL